MWDPSRHALFAQQRILDLWRAHLMSMFCCPLPPSPQDLVIPAFKRTAHFRQSPYMGAAPMPRNTFLFFRGDLRMAPGQDPDCKYSRWVSPPSTVSFASEVNAACVQAARGCA